MTGLFKKVMFLLLKCFLGLGILLVILMVWFDPNAYKPSLAQVLEKAWHRKIYFDGPFRWTFYPFGGLQITRASMGYPLNSSEFIPASLNEKHRFLALQQADISVAFLPLFKKHIVIDRILLKKPVLNIIKTNTPDTQAADRLNKLDQHLKTAETPENPKISNDQDTQITLKNKIKAALTLSRFIIQDGQINYWDAFHNKQVMFDHINMSAQNVILEKPFFIRTTGLLVSDKLKKPVLIFLTANLTVSKDFKQFSLQNINAKAGVYQWEGFLNIDFSKQRFMGLKGQLRVSAQNGVFDGMDVFYYSEAADALLHKQPLTRPNTYQTPFKMFQSRFLFENNLVYIKDFNIEIESMQLSGAGVFNRAVQNLNADLSLQRLTRGTDIKPRGPAIPLHVSGKLPRPAIRPDWNQFLMDQLRLRLSEKTSSDIQQVTENIQKKIQAGLQALL